MPPGSPPPHPCTALVINLCAVFKGVRFSSKLSLIANSTYFLAFSQQIIVNSSEELLIDPILPLAVRVHGRVESMHHKEESLRGFLKSTTEDTSQVESEIQEVKK